MCYVSTYKLSIYRWLQEKERQHHKKHTIVDIQKVKNLIHSETFFILKITNQLLKFVGMQGPKSSFLDKVSDK
jgi:hypothetical protein